MGNIDGRKVTRAEVIHSVFVPGVGQLDSKAFNESVGTPVVSMTIQGHFLFATLRTTGKQLLEIAVPMTNIKAVTLATEVKPLPKPFLKAE